MQFAIVVRPSQDGGYWAEVPTLPGCATQAGTVEDTITNARGAIQSWLAYLHDKGLPLPDQDTVVVMAEVDR